MAGYDFTSTQQAVQGLNTNVMVAQNVINFAAHNVTAAACQILKIPAGSFVTGLWARVITPEGATTTATIGDGTTSTMADAFDASINLNAAAGTMTAMDADTDTYGPGHYYSAADTIDLTPSASCDAAIIKVYATFILDDGQSA